MSNWLIYDEFVEQIIDLHHEGFTGLVTGLSDNQHSFQIGFENGEIMLLAYRVSKGNLALDKMVKIESAKTSIHPTTQVSRIQVSMPNTRDILARLTSHTISGDSGFELSILELKEPEQRKTEYNGSKSKKSNSKLKTAIESAAIHHFGPIASIICEKLLSENDVSGKSYKAVMTDIANEVDASKPDTDAFINSVANP